MTCLLSIDQSTSATKAVLFDPLGKPLDKASVGHRQHYPQAGWVEHDAEELWQNTLAAAGEVLQRLGGRAAELAGVSLTNQRETVVVFDRATGSPLCPAMVWQCRRGDALCEVQRDLGREPSVRERTGLRIDGYFSASKLQWLVRERPDLAERLHAGTALIGTIDTYLVYRLTGGVVFATDHTNASRTLLYDIGKLRWDPEMCGWWQVPPQALAEVRGSSAAFGSTTLGGQLAHPVPIRGVIGDSQAALFAQGCLEPGSAKVTLGTGSSVLLNVGDRLPASQEGVVATIAWVLEGKPAYALEGLINTAAASLTWLRDQLGIITSPEEAEAMAREVSDDSGVYLVPAFSGLGAPWWKPEARGAIVGLSAHSDRRHVAKAAIEAMAYQLHDVLEMLRREAGVRLQHVQVDGGPSVSDWLMQFTADIVETQLHVASHPDSSARGAALLGAIGLGLVPSPGAIASQKAAERVYRPTMAPEQRTLRLQGWRRAVRQVVSLN